jgi:hypothetical protein
MKVDIGDYETLCSQREMYKKDMEKYMAKYVQTKHENECLKIENAIWRKFFDSHPDTDAIKYNGKLFRIVSTAHFKDIDEADTIDVNAVCVDGVN